MEVFREGMSSGKEMGGSTLHPGEGRGLPAAVLFLWPLPPAVLDALGFAWPTRQAATSSREGLPGLRFFS